MRIILVAKAGGGKDFFRDFLSKVEPIDVSYTTRPPRKGEVRGYTYNYINQDDFVEMQANDAFLESVEFNGWKYGTSRFNWNTKKVFIMTPSGLKNIPIEDKHSCVVVYFDIPIEVRRGRLNKRSDSDSVERRIKADEEDFKNFTQYNIRVTNPNFNAESLYSTILTFSRCN